MIKAPDVRPLSEFQRNAKASLQKLKRTRRAQVLTVNGRAAAIMVEPESYWRLLDIAEQAMLGASLQAAMEDFRGGNGVSLAEFDRRMDSKKAEAEEAAAVRGALRDLKAGKGRPLSEFAREFRARKAIRAKRRRSA
jgi:hypothetical protein